MPPTVGHLFRQGREAGVHQVHNILQVSGGWVVVSLAVHTQNCMPAACAGGHAGGPRSMRLTQEVSVGGDHRAGWQGLAGASSTIGLEPWWSIGASNNAPPLAGSWAHLELLAALACVAAHQHLRAGHRVRFVGCSRRSDHQLS